MGAVVITSEQTGHWSSSTSSLISLSKCLQSLLSSSPFKGESISAFLTSLRTLLTSISRVVNLCVASFLLPSKYAFLHFPLLILSSCSYIPLWQSWIISWRRDILSWSMLFWLLISLCSDIIVSSSILPCSSSFSSLFNWTLNLASVFFSTCTSPTWTSPSFLFCSLGLNCFFGRLILTAGGELRSDCLFVDKFAAIQ